MGVCTERGAEGKRRRCGVKDGGSEAAGLAGLGLVGHY